MTIYTTSPLGPVRITGDAAGVSAISVLDESATEIQPLPDDLPDPIAQTIKQLAEYFAGQRQTFDLLLNPTGTVFQQRVWRALLPFGQTRSYLAQSRTLGDEKAIRAVAAANGRNPLWIVVPCHRIIGSDGALTGYAGGLWRKQWLLEHEGARAKTGQLALF
jgi:methylated-DNA-[protein]-cysteine S-methyltransferase